jgi:hypothetical protein
LKDDGRRLGSGLSLSLSVNCELSELLITMGLPPNAAHDGILPVVWPRLLTGVSSSFEDDTDDSEVGDLSPRVNAAAAVAALARIADVSD